MNRFAFSQPDAAAITNSLLAAGATRDGAARCVSMLEAFADHTEFTRRSAKSSEWRHSKALRIRDLASALVAEMSEIDDPYDKASMSGRLVDLNGRLIFTGIRPDGFVAEAKEYDEILRQLVRLQVGAEGTASVGFKEKRRRGHPKDEIGQRLAGCFLMVVDHMCKVDHVDERGQTSRYLIAAFKVLLAAAHPMGRANDGLAAQRLLREAVRHEQSVKRRIEEEACRDINLEREQV